MFQPFVLLGNNFRSVNISIGLVFGQPGPKVLILSDISENRNKKQPESTYMIQMPHESEVHY